MLALKEILHSKLKFGLIALAVSLILGLVIIMSAISEGLVTGMTGAVGSLDGDAVVFQGETYLSMERSVLTPESLQEIKKAEGVKGSYRVGHVMISVKSNDEPFDAHAFGLEEKALEDLPVIEGDGGETLEKDKAIVDISAEGDGVEIGDVVKLEPTGLELEVVGFTENRRYVMAPVFYINMDTWEEIRIATTLGKLEEASQSEVPSSASQDGPPDSSVADFVDGSSTVAVVDLEDGVTPEDFDEILGNDFDAVPVKEAALGMNGMPIMIFQVNAIQIVALLIGAMVIGVFFYIMTLHKTGQIAAIKALGASNGYLYRQLILQITFIVTIGVIVGGGLAIGGGSSMPPEMGFDLKLSRLAVTIVAIYMMAYLGSLFSLQSILKIDPAIALDSGEH